MEFRSVVAFFLLFFSKAFLFCNSTATIENFAVGNFVSEGNEADKKQFPWQVLIEVNFTDKQKYCGGVILSMNWVLTAAQCVKGAENILLNFGSTIAHNPKIQIRASREVTHPDYKSARHNDISLLELQVPLRFTETIQPVLLPAKDQIGVSFVGVKSRFAGWDTNLSNITQPGELLKWVDVKVIKNADCASDYGSIVTNSVLCTRGGSICGCDFGGPLIVEEKEGWVLIGIASFHQGCNSDKPVGFSRVTSYLTWICEITGIEITF